MVQPWWTMIDGRIAPFGLLTLILLSIIVMNLQNTSMHVSVNDVYNFRSIFPKERDVENSVIRMEEHELHMNKSQDIMQNVTNQLRDTLQNITKVVWPIKATINYGIENGYIIIVNASSECEANSADSIFVAASQHRATSDSWNINGALDGNIGELIAEILEEVHRVEGAQDAIDKTMNSCKCDNIDKSPIDGDMSKENLESTIDWPYKLHWYGPSLHSLVVFSSFRFSHTDFYVIALRSTLPLENPWPKEAEFNTCAWIHMKQKSSKFNDVGSSLFTTNMPIIQMGTQNITIINEAHRTAYDVVVIKCTFEDPAGANAKGGHLYIKINDEFCPVFSEKPEEVDTIQFEGDFKYKYAFCSPPILWDYDATCLKEWFLYHHYHFHAKRVHYFIYHGINITDDIKTLLDPLMKQGLLTLIDIRSSQRSVLSGQYPSHHLTINDCLHRVRYLAKWAFFWSFEDYLTISAPYTLTSLLEKYKNNPWISFGSIQWSNKYCCAPSHQAIMLNISMWKVDEMCFRKEHPICKDNSHSTTCTGIEGQRKWIANPRLVFAASVHYALDSQSGGMVLDTDVARFNVYKGLLNPILSKDNCIVVKLLEDIDGDTTPLDGMWWKDLSMQNYTELAHIYADSINIFNENPINSSSQSLYNVTKNTTIGL